MVVQNSFIIDSSLNPVEMILFVLATAELPLREQVSVSRFNAMLCNRFSYVFHDCVHCSIKHRCEAYRYLQIPCVFTVQVVYCESDFASAFIVRGAGNCADYGHSSHVSLPALS